MELVTDTSEVDTFDLSTNFVFLLCFYKSLGVDAIAGRLSCLYFAIYLSLLIPQHSYYLDYFLPPLILCENYSNIEFDFFKSTSIF